MVWPSDLVLLSSPSDLQHKDPRLRSPAGERDATANQTKTLTRLRDYFRVCAAALAHGSASSSQAAAMTTAQLQTRLMSRDEGLIWLSELASSAGSFSPLPSSWNCSKTEHTRADSKKKDFLLLKKSVTLSENVTLFRSGQPRVRFRHRFKTNEDRKFTKTPILYLVLFNNRWSLGTRTCAGRHHSSPTTCKVHILWPSEQKCWLPSVPVSTALTAMARLRMRLRG